MTQKQNDPQNNKQEEAVKNHQETFQDKKMLQCP